MVPFHSKPSAGNDLMFRMDSHALSLLSRRYLMDGNTDGGKKERPDVGSLIPVTQTSHVVRTLLDIPVVPCREFCPPTPAKTL